MLSLGDRFLKSLEEEGESLTESLTCLTRWIESRVFLREIFCESVMMKNLFFPSSSSSSFSLENRTNTLTEETRVKSFEKIVRSKAPPPPPPSNEINRWNTVFNPFSRISLIFFLRHAFSLHSLARRFFEIFRTIRNKYIYIIVSIRNHLIRVANERMRNGTTHRLA